VVTKETIAEGRQPTLVTEAVSDESAEPGLDALGEESA
jgi:hypothetical protein